jgi:hypothetical protein
MSADAFDPHRAGPELRGGMVENPRTGSSSLKGNLLRQRIPTPGWAALQSFGLELRNGKDNKVARQPSARRRMGKG